MWEAAGCREDSEMRTQTPRQRSMYAQDWDSRRNINSRLFWSLVCRLQKQMPMSWINCRWRRYTTRSSRMIKKALPDGWNLPSDRATFLFFTGGRRFFSYFYTLLQSGQSPEYECKTSLRYFPGLFLRRHWKDLLPLQAFRPAL